MPNSESKPLSRGRLSLLLTLVITLFLVALYSGIKRSDNYLIEVNKHEEYLIIKRKLEQMGIPDYREKEWRYMDKELKAQKLPPLTAETINQHIDFNLIKSLEGNVLIGYVPSDKNGTPIGQSGVTVGAGFDIGQHSIKELHEIGFSDTLITKLSPYCGLKKWNAVTAIHHKPLIVTSEEADTINSLVSVSKVRGIINEVGEDVWDKMNLGLRTVLASVNFQYGDAKSKTPNLFKLIISQNIEGVIKLLDNFGDKYPTRRKAEASYLKQISLETSDKTKA